MYANIFHIDGQHSSRKLVHLDVLSLRPQINTTMLQDLLTRNALNFEKKKSNFVMIVIHIGILMYPVKDSAESSLVFSKHRVF